MVPLRHSMQTLHFRRSHIVLSTNLGQQLTLLFMLNCNLTNTRLYIHNHRRYERKFIHKIILVSIYFNV